MSCRKTLLIARAVHTEQGTQDVLPLHAAAMGTQATAMAIAMIMRRMVWARDEHRAAKKHTNMA